MTNLSCVWNSGLTPLKKIKLKDVAAKVNGGRVLDIGCGDTGFYWSLAYVEKADDIVFYDKNDALLKALNEKISNLSPENFDETALSAFEFLKDEGLVVKSESLDELLEMILDVAGNIKKFDFVNDAPVEKFDSIIALEALACVNSREDFEKAILNCSNMLNNGGQLIGISDRYIEQNETVFNMSKVGNEGLLNPDVEEYEKAFFKANMTIKKLEKKTLLNVTNYDSIIIFEAIKNV